MITQAILWVVFPTAGFLLAFSKVTPADPNDPYFPENLIKKSKD
jgi:hypothetical protein